MYKMLYFIDFLIVITTIELFVFQYNFFVCFANSINIFLNKIYNKLYTHNNEKW